MKSNEKFILTAVLLAGIIAVFTVIIVSGDAMRRQSAFHQEAIQKALVKTHAVLVNKNAKIKALTKENLELRKKLLKKAKLPSRQSVVPAIMRGGQQFVATAYTHSGYNTASGVYPRAGRTIAVDRRLIRLGTKVTVRCPSAPEYDGVYTAEDTGGAICGNRVDIFIDTRHEAINFGKRKVFVSPLD